MALDTIRQNIATAVEAAKVGATPVPLVVEYDNRIVVDTKVQTLPFLCVHVKFMEGYQADMSNNPIHRLHGQIHIAVAAKEGSGSAAALKILDYIYPQLQMKNLGPVKTKAASPTVPYSHLGWIYYPVLIPFWFDKTYGV